MRVRFDKVGEVHCADGTLAGGSVGGGCCNESRSSLAMASTDAGADEGGEPLARVAATDGLATRDGGLAAADASLLCVITCRKSVGGSGGGGGGVAGTCARYTVPIVGTDVAAAGGGFSALSRVSTAT